MALSSVELNNIHSRSLATPGRKYYGDNEKVYLGTKEKKLKLLEEASLVTFQPTSVASVICSISWEEIVI